MKKLIWIQILLFFAINSFSQNEYIPGYIILNTNDTIHGKIINERDIFSGIYCIFQNKDSSITRQYLPTEIKSYHLSNNRYFISKRILIENIQRIVFLQVLIEGELNIYRYKDIKRDIHYFIENKTLGISELWPAKESMEVIENQPYMKTLRPYIGVLQYYTANEPIFKNRFKNLLDISGSSLIEIATDYHVLVCKKDDCKVYFYEY